MDELKREIANEVLNIILELLKGKEKNISNEEHVTKTETIKKEYKRNNEKKKIICYKCGEKGHVSRNCRRNNMNYEYCGKNNHKTEDCYRKRKCNKCKGIGHTEDFCRKTIKGTNRS